MSTRIMTIEMAAEDIQQDCHKAVEAIIKSSNKEVGVQDATNVFLFRTLAEYQLRIEDLEQKVEDLENLPATEFPRGQKI